MKTYPHNNNYAITKDGLVWSKINKRFLNPANNGNGYLRTYLGRGLRKYVHELVLETYVGNKPKGTLARHVDGNQQNNNVSNLVWGTQQENMDDMKKHCIEKGKRAGNSKITPDDVLTIRQMCNAGIPQKIISNLYNVWQSCISKINLRISWAWVQ